MERMFGKLRWRVEKSYKRRTYKANLTLNYGH